MSNDSNGQKTTHFDGVERDDQTHNIAVLFVSIVNAGSFVAYLSMWKLSATRAKEPTA